jgi:pimeloyl-ACP methyl ester carboxylesterase
VPPDLPGLAKAVDAPWGSCNYRIIERDLVSPPLLLIHGWGRTADSAWWTIYHRTSRTIISVDLPGDGSSDLGGRFALEDAARAIDLVLEHSGYPTATLVGHSMGGAVALAAAHDGGARYPHVVVIAGAAHWFGPRLWATLVAAPFAMAKRSPFLVRARLRDIERSPDSAQHVAWSCSLRPSIAVTRQSAAALRQFDARGYEDALPPITWVVTSDDGIINPRHQRASAEMFGANVIELEGGHSIVHEQPGEIAEIIEGINVLSPAVTG